ncbi:hypothetical protein BDP27DRAFT_1445989 [Rhodocollybia butyracea]|uniref:Uncharacterized protein n=1 Tax=Rhodocollybia butyracea TaxID=206335 RepID=A0A9P5UBD7_9AGAR|nr:hypothetical protein BDP27DRAFT_1445989 [Rhodocollybia butyracea]
MIPLHFAGIILAVCVASWSTLSKHSETSAPLEHVQQRPFVEASHKWDIHIPPSENATGHLVFQSVSSLLQHWPNARYRNGHTIVAGTVPLGTLLYHGRSDSKYPQGAEWTATDPEHSFLFCIRPCWHLTVVTTRPLNVLYFDGSSAVKMHGGSMDSQDMLLWGERKTDKVFSEEERLAQLCQWGKEFGLDGFVRMEMNFEVMLCDFGSGVETVSFLQLANASPSHKQPTDDSPPDPEAETDRWISEGHNPAVTIRNFELMHSSSRYNQYPGDTRIRLDLTRLVSFYDPELAPSLTQVRAQELKGNRWLYDLLKIEPQDIDILHRKLREALSEIGHGERVTSGVDWETLYQVIIKRFGSRLENLHHVLRSDLGSTILDEEDRILKSFAQVNIMLTPYIPYGVKPNLAAPNPMVEGDSPPSLLAWASPAYEMCSTSHTSYISSSTDITKRMTASEKLLLGAVQDTTKEICRVLVKMWSTGVEAGLDLRYWVRRTAGTVAGENQDPFGALVENWRRELEGLMEWLDWHMWVKCSPACSNDELCYMPTWPYFGGPPAGPSMGPTVEDMGETKEWERPMPKCIRKIAPYSF